MSDTGARITEPAHLGVVEVDAMRNPHVVGDPTQIVEHGHGPAAEAG